MAILTEEVQCNSIKELIANLERPAAHVSDGVGSRIVHGNQHDAEELLKDEYLLRGQDFIFRGMAKSSWALLPSLFRNLQGVEFNRRIAQLVGVNRYKGSFDFPTFESFNGNFSEEHYKIRIALITEFYLLEAFYRNANLNGLKVSQIDTFDQNFSSAGFCVCGGESGIIREYFGGRDRYGETTDFPFIKYENVGALAQHYGIATRFLDWSYDMMVALYFAVIGAARDIVDNHTDVEDNFCAVWVMDAGNLVPYLNNKLRVVTPPYFDNPNLNAQKGVLTYWNANDFEDYLLPLDEQISSYFGSRMDCKPLLSQKRFYKYTLPYSEIKYALKYLIIKGYTAAKLFPGYKGVVEAMDEYRLCQLLSEPEKVDNYTKRLDL